MSESELLVRDPLYGLIRITPNELSMLKTIPVTRMRWIKQMGLACLVFPGANHTRLEHSIGTLFVANRLAEGLRRKNGEDFSDENIKAIRFATLLHDLGHSPLARARSLLLSPRKACLKHLCFWIMKSSGLGWFKIHVRTEV